MVLVTEIENTLWGIVIDGKKKIEHNSDRPLHISMASLDTSVKSDEFVPLMIHREKDTYLLCTLHSPNILQQNLNLEINKGEKVTFYLNSSSGNVHLTGYYITEQLDNFDENENQQELMKYLAKNGCGDEHCTEDHGLDEHDDDEDDDDDDDDDEDSDEDDTCDVEEEIEMNGKKRKLNDGKALDLPNKKRAVDEDDEDDDDDDDDEGEDEDEEDDDEDEEDDEEDEDEEDDDEDEEEEPPKLVNAQDKSKQQATNGQANNNNQTKTVNGVIIKESKIGHGPEIKKGKYAHVYYHGKLKQNGKTFDSCLNGKPFKFRLGAGDVIKGWDIGVAGMKVGGKRTLTIPANLAYGNKKMADIPANSTLIFDVELKSVS